MCSYQELNSSANRRAQQPLVSVYFSFVLLVWWDGHQRRDRRLRRIVFGFSIIFPVFFFIFFSSLPISATQGNMEAVWPRIIYQDFFFFFFSLSSLSKWLVCGETVEPPSRAIRPPSTSPCGERKIRENWKWRGKRRRERDHCFSTSLSLPLSLLWAWLAAKLKRLVINLGEDGSSSATGLDWWRRGWRLFLSVCVCVWRKWRISFWVMWSHGRMWSVHSYPGPRGLQHVCWLVLIQSHDSSKCCKQTGSLLNVRRVPNLLFRA